MNDYNKSIIFFFYQWLIFVMLFLIFNMTAWSVSFSLQSFNIFLAVLFIVLLLSAFAGNACLFKVKKPYAITVTILSIFSIYGTLWWLTSKMLSNLSFGL